MNEPENNKGSQPPFGNGSTVVHTVTFPLGKNELDTRFCLDDLLNSIPTVLQKQKVSMTEEQIETFKVYQKKVQDPGIIPTLSATETTDLLNTMGALLTHIDDVDVSVKKVKMYREEFDTTRHFFCRKNEQLLTSEQAMLEVFRRCVCGVNWNLKKCKKHGQGSRCCADYKNLILKTMQHYLDNKTSLIRYDNLRLKIEELRKSCFSTADPLYSEKSIFFNSMKEDGDKETLLYGTEKIHVSKYHEVANHYDLALYNTLLFESFGHEDDDMFVWLARFYIMIGWADQFFGHAEATEEYTKAIFESFKIIVPMESRERLYEILMPAWEQMKNFVSNLKSQVKKKGTKNKMLKIPRCWRTKSPEEKLDYIRANLESGLDITNNTRWSFHMDDSVYEPTPKLFGNELEMLVKPMFYIFNRTEWDDYWKANAESVSYKDVTSFSRMISKTKETGGFLRVQSAGPQYSTTNYNCFSADVFEVVRSILKKQGRPEEFIQEHYNFLKQAFPTQMNTTIKWLTEKQMKCMVQAACIDLRDIMLLPDISQQLSMEETLHCSSTPITIMAPNGEPAVDVDQMILHIFISVVCGMNCPKAFELDGFQAFNKLWLRAAKEHETMTSEGEENMNLISKRRVTRHISLLKSHEIFTQLPETETDYLLDKHGVYDDIPLETYHKICEEFQLIKYEFRKQTLPMWKTRMYLIVGWICSFHGKHTDYAKIKDVLLQTQLLKVPMKHRMEAKEFADKVSGFWNRDKNVNVRQQAQTTKQSTSLQSDTAKAKPEVKAGSEVKEKPESEDERDDEGRPGQDAPVTEAYLSQLVDIYTNSRNRVFESLRNNPDSFIDGGDYDEDMQLQRSTMALFESFSEGIRHISSPERRRPFLDGKPFINKNVR